MQTKSFARVSDGSSFQNPIIKTGADPWVIEAEGMYYYCHSNNDNAIYVRSAANPALLGEAEDTLIWKAPKGQMYSKETWAPELHRLDGKWYVYFAASNGDNSTHRMYVLEADQPFGPYRFKGPIAAATDRWAIDGTILEGADGNRYYLWSGWDGFTNIQQNIYIAKMETPWSLCKPDDNLISVRISPHRVRTNGESKGIMDMRVSVERAGTYVLEIPYHCTSHAMHRLQVNGEAHFGTHYVGYGARNWQTHYEIIELREGDNLLEFTAGIGDVTLGEPTMKAFGTDRIAISGPEHHWEKLGGPAYINEGPQILVRDGRVHVIYSASGSWTDDYQLGHLSLQGDNPMDPKNWKKHGPVFQKTESVFGPGHASFIRYNNMDWIVYHAAKFSGAGWKRQVRMQAFTWDAANNPVFGIPLPNSYKHALEPAAFEAELKQEGA